MTPHRVQTFGVGFDTPGFSELPYARLVADHFGTEHHELMVHAADLVEYWPLLTWHRDEPVSEPSDLGMYLIAKMARQHVTVVLSGEGGDELFAGYPKYAVDWLARYYHLIPERVRAGAIMPALDRLPYGARKLKSAARSISQPSPERWMRWFGIINGPLKEQLLLPQVRSSVDMDGSRVFRQHLARNPQRDDLSAMLYLDTKIWLPDNLLMKGDKMTMAASLEARVPLLDYRLVEYAASIPSAMKVKPFRAKYLFKRAYADFLPEVILTRKKMGFNVPVSAWFGGPHRDLLRQLLLSERARGRGFFDMTVVQRLLDDHLAGRANYGGPLFHLASLELWFRVYIDPAGVERPERTLPEMLAEDTGQLVGASPAAR